MYQPAWGATCRKWCPGTISCRRSPNGIGFNLARALGPALGGILVLFGGPSLAFGLFAISFLASIAALLAWRRRKRRSSLPPEHLISAMRVGMQFVRHTPAMRAAIIRSAAYFLPAAAPWAMLPLIVREQLGLGAGSFGMLLGLMGVGGVTAGMLLPRMRGFAGRGAIVFGSTMFSAAGMACIAATHHWAPAALGMFLFGIGWVAASSTAQAAAQLVAPPWVRARALAIYQLAFNGALAFGSMLWGSLGDRSGCRRPWWPRRSRRAALGSSCSDTGWTARPPRPPRRRRRPCRRRPRPSSPPPSRSSRGRILETMRSGSPRGTGRCSCARWPRSSTCAAGPGRWTGGLYEDVAHPGRMARGLGGGELDRPSARVRAPVGRGRASARPQRSRSIPRRRPCLPIARRRPTCGNWYLNAG